MIDFLINRYEAKLAFSYINEFTYIEDIEDIEDIELDDKGILSIIGSINNSLVPDGDKVKLNKYEQEIDNVLYRYAKTEKEEKEIKTKLKNHIKKYRLTDEDLIWINKKDIRLCNWIWYLFYSRSYNKIIKRNTINDIILDNNDNTHDERYISLINSFKKSNYTKEDKILLIDKLKAIWSEKVITYRKVTELIEEKNTKQSIWAYNYIIKTFNPRFDRNYFNINNEYDYYHIVICYFDGIDNTYEKNDKFTSLKNAWAQKKYRDDNNGKKSYNFNMSVDIAKKLNILAINSNRNKNYIVEELINNEYSKLKK